VNVNCPIKIRAGIGIGTLHLKQSKKEVEALGMPMKIVEGLTNGYVIGRYSVNFDTEDMIKMIGADIGDLPECVFVGNKKILPTVTGRNLSRRFSRCGKVEVHKGGSLIHCSGIDIVIAGLGTTEQSPSVRIASE
jgi:hypothetical protein